jgi:hypothetical protein
VRGQDTKRPRKGGDVDLPHVRLGVVDGVGGREREGHLVAGARGSREEAGGAGGQGKGGTEHDQDEEGQEMETKKRDKDWIFSLSLSMILQSRQQAAALVGKRKTKSNGDSKKDALIDFLFAHDFSFCKLKKKKNLLKTLKKPVAGRRKLKFVFLFFLSKLNNLRKAILLLFFAEISNLFIFLSLFSFPFAQIEMS